MEKTDRPIVRTRARKAAFSLIELLVAIALIVILASVAVPAGVSAFRSSSLAVSASNIRQLAAGGAAYLGENNYRFWPYLERSTDGDLWWFGLEPSSSKGKREGERELDTSKGPLAPYMPRNMMPDPSFRFSGKPFKPKYKFGHIGAGYNVLLANGWVTGSSAKAKKPLRYWDLKNPGQTVVFATSAQVYPFDKRFIEEFYGIDERQVTVHFRHNGQAMVAFADGSAGFLPMDPSTRDNNAPKADIGRFAPKGSTKYLR
jgi:prepilin-type N-terminal cleavage/methylation domain-containing protein/prepilin-type processing-associated H-X9-DG protein